MLPHSQKDLVEYPSTGKMVLLSFLAIAFVVLGGVFITVGVTEEEKSVLLILVGLLSVMFFGLALIYLIYRVVDRKPSILIDDEGITDNSSYTGGGRLRWEEIQEIFPYELMGQRFIGIRLKDNDAYLARQSGLKKALMSINRGMVKAPVNIAQTGVKMPLEELYAIMMDRWNRAVGGGSR